MGWEIEIGDAARRQLGSMDRVAAKRVLAFLRDRVEHQDPRRIGRPLRGSRFANLWRYRIGDYRVIADLQDATMRVLVVKVGHRREVYD